MSERKDRLIQTRVPEKLESTLKKAALERRTTVSQMIRNILEDSFELVDGVVASVDAIVSDSVALAQQVGRDVRRIGEAKPRTRPPCRAPLADAGSRLAGVRAWQAVVLNRPLACARCGLELPRGSDAYRGVGEDPAAAESFVCAASVKALAAGAGLDVRERAARWLSGIDTALQTLERTLWAARDGALALSDRAAHAWEELADDWLRVEGDLRELGAELGAWPRRLERLVDAGWMLAGVAASYRLHPTHAALLPEPRARAALARLHARNASRFAETSARQGAGMLKVGQLLSTRPDLLPEVWIRELSKLQDAAPPVPFAALRQRIEADLGGTLAAHFSHFEEQPVAAASIGVVHRATTRSGVDVAVKITRPDVRECLELDLDLLELFLESVKPMFPPADYPTIVAEIRAMLRQELDYRVEARMMERLADFFADRERVVVPRTLPELCGHDVLVSHFSEGRKITLVLDELRALRDAGNAEAGARLDRILSLLLETYARQILVAGVFQADPHPGNFLVTADDRLVLLDFGCTRTLAAPVRDRYLALVGAFLLRDGERLAALLAELGFATASGAPATLHAFAELLLGEFRAAMQSAGRGGLDAQAMLANAKQAMARMQDDPVIRIPAEFVMIARVFLSLGGLFQHYRPAIDYSRALLAVLAERSQRGVAGSAAVTAAQPRTGPTEATS